MIRIPPAMIAGGRFSPVPKYTWFGNSTLRKLAQIWNVPLELWVCPCVYAYMCIRETMGQPRVSLLRCRPTVVCALDRICRWHGTRQVG